MGKGDKKEGKPHFTAGSTKNGERRMSAGEGLLPTKESLNPTGEDGNPLLFPEVGSMCGTPAQPPEALPSL